jgi:hypothetical protein
LNHASIPIAVNLVPLVRSCWALLRCQMLHIKWLGVDWGSQFSL